MRRRAIRVCLLSFVLTAIASAQTARVPMRISGPPASGSFSRHTMPRAFYSGFPLWSDSYFPTNESAAPVIVLQPPAAPAERVTGIPDEPKSAAPLLIEWQGDRYVRRTTISTTTSRATQPDYVAEAKSNTVANTPTARSFRTQVKPARTSKTDRAPYPSEALPTTFVFRDGHHEESDDYSIISGVIYARGDYWTTGQWSRQIKLSQLDLPATIKANQQQGVPFRVPTAPNEVITRP